VTHHLAATFYESFVISRIPLIMRTRHIKALTPVSKSIAAFIQAA